MVDAQTVLEVVPALGVIVALLYYSMTIRNTEKLRRKDFIFQSNLARTPEYYRIFNRVWQMYDYETAEEFDKKYSPEQQAEFAFCQNHINVIGNIYKEKVASVEEIFQIYPPNVVISLFELQWPIMESTRVRTHNPELFKPFELLYREARSRFPEYVPGWQKNVVPSRALHP